MLLTIAYTKIKKRNLVLNNNATYQRETLSERPIRQPLKSSTISSSMGPTNNWPDVVPSYGGTRAMNESCRSVTADHDRKICRSLRRSRKVLYFARFFSSFRQYVFFTYFPTSNFDQTWSKRQLDLCR